jgi:hypothetical protein
MALAQELAFKTPDTSIYLKLGYSAIVGVIGAYLIFLWVRARKER